MYRRPTDLDQQPNATLGRRRRNLMSILLGQITGWYRRGLKWHSRRKAAEDLRSMPDYLLKDIGISRSQIDTVIRHSKRR